MSKIVIDTSILINGQLIAQLEAGNIENTEIIIPQAVFDELQSQASQKKEQGFVGLEEIKKIKDISSNFSITISVQGSHPSTDDIKLAGRGRIDAMIKDVAKQNNATLYTSDTVQHLVAQAEGVDSVLIKPIIKEEKLEFLKFFDENTMSIHLKENLPPMAKKGRPGDFQLVKINEKPLSKEYLEFVATQILEAAKINDSSTIEISKPGASVIQHHDYRIAITRTPFSESLEITIVHPIVKLALDDYQISDELMKRFSDRAEGIIISGPPGSGKSTLASGLANFYNAQGKIVKTFESPRDLQVDPQITQYTKLDGSFDNTADILLLVRPDFTTFADLRLTGVGMVGVVHANSPLDAIQRFIGKIELGIIPNVLDTVVFVKDGRIDKVYELELTVKVPSGMTESDLARPVIDVKNFENNSLEYEIYTFGEENVIVPVGKQTTKIGIESLAQEKIREVFKRYDPRAQVEILSNNKVRVFVDKQYIPSIIGKGGSNINELEQLLKVHIDVMEKDSSNAPTSLDSTYELPFTFSETKTALILIVSREYTSMHADIYVNDKYLTSTRIGKKGQIKIPKKTDTAKSLMHLASSQNDINIFLKDF